VGLNPIRPEGGGNCVSGCPECRQEGQDRIRHGVCRNSPGAIWGAGPRRIASKRRVGACVPPVRQAEAASRASPATGLYIRPGGESLTAASLPVRTAVFRPIVLNRIRKRIPPAAARDVAPANNLARTHWKRRIRSLIIATVRRSYDVEACHERLHWAGWSIGVGPRSRSLRLPRAGQSRCRRKVAQ
jgi:hypothetical protein